MTFCKRVTIAGEQAGKEKTEETSKRAREVMSWLEANVE
jgi:hypothetical protein